MITCHSDVVGSLLRPTELLDAQKKFAAGTITADEFKEIEDRAVAVDNAIALQESIGLEVVTDGDSCPRQMTRTNMAVELQALISSSWMRERMG